MQYIGRYSIVIGGVGTISEPRGEGIAQYDTTKIACNRAIEQVRADYWIWVDRFHYERSKWHPNAKAAIRYGPTSVSIGDDEARHYDISTRLPGPDYSLFLWGGTLTVAAHLAVRLGARRVVFVGCDAWTPDRDRYHAWDGKPLDERGREEHRIHLERTAEGIRRLAEFYKDVEFLDATQGPQYLGLPFVELASLVSRNGRVREKSMAKKAGTGAAILPDQQVPMGYGRLVSVTPLGPKEVILWFEDSAGTLRALRMGCDSSEGLALELKGHAQIARS